MKKGYVRTILVVLGLVALVESGMILGVAFLGDRLLFHPSRVIAGSPADARLKHEEIRFRTPDGETLSGWFVPASEPVATLLFLHGNAGNISHRLRQIAALRAAGLSVMIIDYRGFGESTGSPSEKGLYLDARAAWDELIRVRGVPAGEVALYGESIGSAAALHLARGLNREGAALPAAIVLEGAFTSGVDMGRRAFPFLPIGWLAKGRLDNIAVVRDIAIPLLSIHGGEDEIVPMRMGRSLFEASPAGVKKFHEVRGAEHNTVWMSGDREIPGIIRGFIEGVLRSRAPRAGG